MGTPLNQLRARIRAGAGGEGDDECASSNRFRLHPDREPAQPASADFSYQPGRCD